MKELDLSEDEDENKTLENTKTNNDKKKKKKKKPTSKPEPVQKIKSNPLAKLAQERVRLIEEENARIKAEQDAEERKIKDEEEREAAKLKAIQDEKEKKKKKKNDKIEKKKLDGTFKTKSEKDKEQKNIERRQLIKKTCIIQDGKIITKSIIRKDNNQSKQNDIVDYNYRSPIFCIMGHVDTGKTKLLDKIRNTNVQEGEAGGITQQIGATFIPKESLLIKSNTQDIKIPGILMIDTPGHEAFANLRLRGSSLCDIAIVVIDIVHGLEQQTIQSINILRDSNIKFIFALNKIDRLYGWTSVENRNIKESLNENKLQLDEFNNRLNKINCDIMSLGINVKLFWENDSIEDTISICPISAITGEGICDLLTYVIKMSQDNLTEEIKIKDELKCVIMEKTITEGVGASIDAILINGSLKKGDIINFQTNDGISKTTIRNLLTPPPNKESRIKSEYIHHNFVKGSMGVKIVANDLDRAIVGSQIYFENEKIELKEDISEFKLQSNGVTVFASTQGALEALIYFLQNECKPPVPVFEVYIGNVMKKHIDKMIINKSDKKEFSTILAFNVNVVTNVEDFAKKNSIKIFNAEIIYHLFDQYTKYRNDIINERKMMYKSEAIFPCSLKILENNIFRKKNPLIFGVSVLDGNVRLGTPIITDEKVIIGKVTGIRSNDKDIEIGKKGMEVCIKVENNDSIAFDRQFSHKNKLFSSISRNSINVLKEHFSDEITKDDAQLISKIKSILGL
jgi:translation initiation factor aIF-2/yIF-2